MSKTFKFDNEGDAKAFVKTVGIEGLEIVSATEIKTATAASQEEIYRIVEYYYEYNNQRIDRLHQRISDLSEALYSHKSEGHLPKIQGAGQMASVLKKLGMEDDYNVYKKSVFANTLEVGYEKNNPLDSDA